MRILGGHRSGRLRRRRLPEGIAMHGRSAFATLCSRIVAIYLFFARAVLNRMSTTSVDSSR